MHIGKTLLEHIKKCEKCQYRYYSVMHNKAKSVSSMIRHADNITNKKTDEDELLKELGL